jgi:hypothetical protein
VFGIEETINTAREKPQLCVLRTGRMPRIAPGRDGAPCRPRPRQRADRTGGVVRWPWFVPSPDASLGDGDGAARHSYRPAASFRGAVRGCARPREPALRPRAGIPPAATFLIRGMRRVWMQFRQRGGGHRHFTGKPPGRNAGSGWLPVRTTGWRRGRWKTPRYPTNGLGRILKLPPGARTSGRFNAQTVAGNSIHLRVSVR